MVSTNADKFSVELMHGDAFNINDLPGVIEMLWQMNPLKPVCLHVNEPFSIPKIFEGSTIRLGCKFGWEDVYLTDSESLESLSYARLALHEDVTLVAITGMYSTAKHTQPVSYTHLTLPTKA